MKIHLNGWLGYDSDGIIAISDNKNANGYHYESIPNIIYNHATHSWEYDRPGLGGMRSVLPNTSMRMYVTDKECTLDDAMATLISELYGDVETDIAYEGYSEWTITGYDLEKFEIGGHDLSTELGSFVGKYIHLIFETE